MRFSRARIPRDQSTSGLYLRSMVEDRRPAYGYHLVFLRAVFNTDRNDETSIYAIM